MKNAERMNRTLKKIIEERNLDDCENRIRIIFAKTGMNKSVVFDAGRPRLA